MRSVYSIERVGEVQCLVDENQGRSLTNDIETVMQELTAAGTWQRGIPAHPDGYLTAQWYGRRIVARRRLRK